MVPGNIETVIFVLMREKETSLHSFCPTNPHRCTSASSPSHSPRLTRRTATSPGALQVPSRPPAIDNSPLVEANTAKASCDSYIHISPSDTWSTDFRVLNQLPKFIYSKNKHYLTLHFVFMGFFLLQLLLFSCTTFCSSLTCRLQDLPLTVVSSHLYLIFDTFISHVPIQGYIKNLDIKHPYLTPSLLKFLSHSTP